MDCSDLNRFLNNEMTKEDQEIFREHTEQCKVCKIQTEFYNSLKINKIPQLPENFEVSVMTKIHNKPKFYGFAIFALCSAFVGIIATITTNYFELVHILKTEHYPHMLLQLVDKLNFLVNQFIYLWEHLSYSITTTVPDFLFFGAFVVFLIFMLYNLSLKERL